MFSEKNPNFSLRPLVIIDNQQNPVFEIEYHNPSKYQLWKNGYVERALHKVGWPHF